MQQKTIEKKLIHLHGQSENLSYLISRARVQAAEGNFYEYNAIMEELILTLRKNETDARNLLLHSSFVDKYKVMGMIAEDMNITVELEPEGWYKIHIPAVVPKKMSRHTANFITEPLAHVLDQYVLHHSPKHVPIEKCTVCFRDVFDKDMPERMIRDTDNTEYKKLLDVVAARLMKDDNGLWCDMIHQIMPGDVEHTEIYVVPAGLFPLWYKKYPKF